MQLDIKNIAKIKEATININGITVIAGENNTGKSTIGKVLFSVFNSMYNINSKIDQERKNEIYQLSYLLLQGNLIVNERNSIEYQKSHRKYPQKFTADVIKYLQNNTNGDISNFIKKFVYENNLYQNIDDENDFINDFATRLTSIINVPDEKIMTEILTRWFNKVFEKQISPLMKDNVESKINLNIKNKNSTFNFKNNICTSWKSEFNILHEAFYIDNPFIVDYMSDEFLRNTVKTTDSHLLDYLCKKSKGIYDGIFDSIIVKEKLDEIYTILENVIVGDIIQNQEGKYCLNSKKYYQPLNIKNLSTGLKSFTIIKQLLENGSLKEKDILILDEPEIHLHPEWQLIYAELIVQLQKKFDLSIIITTHSPYFLDAIDVYTAKYEISNKVNYYLAENENSISCLYNVTNNLDAIYKKLSDPMQVLENMRSEL